MLEVEEVEVIGLKPQNTSLNNLKPVVEELEAVVNSESLGVPMEELIYL